MQVVNNFTGVGAGTPVSIEPDDSLGYTISGAFTGTWILERSTNGGATWQQVDSGTGPDARRIATQKLGFNAALFRVSVTAITAGNLVAIVDESKMYPVSRTKVSTVPIGSVPYASFGNDTVMVAGTIYYAEIFVRDRAWANGIGILNGSVSGTDKFIVALFDTSGSVIANSPVAGVLAAGVNAFQEIAFKNPVELTKSRYFIGVQSNGTTARIRTVAANTFIDLAGGSQAGTFGSAGNVTLPVALTPNTAPIAYIFW